MTNLSFHIKQDGPDTGTKYREDKEVFEISAKGAFIFIIVASVFLLLLFYFMSSWFVWVLIVLFCIGGIEVFPPFGHSNSSILY
jgi:signal peptide peptidase-like 2B